MWADQCSNHYPAGPKYPSGDPLGRDLGLPRTLNHDNGGLSVYFVCLDLEGSQDGFCVRLDQLHTLGITRRRFGPVLALPISQGLPVSLTEPFYDAFERAMAVS